MAGIVIAFWALVIALIVQTVRYLRAKSGIYSKAKVREAAWNQANHLSYQDPVITCDYCGTKFDTRVHKVCPHCGGAFDEDEEWTARHAVEEKFVDEGARAVMEEQERRAMEEAQVHLKKMRRLLVVLGVFIAVIVGLMVVAIQREKAELYLKNQELNDREYITYTQAPYEVAEGEVLVNRDDFTWKVIGFYDSDDEEESAWGESHRMRVGFEIDNRTNQDLKVVLQGTVINGVARQDGYCFLYGVVRRNSKVTVYEDMHNVPASAIKDIRWSEVKVYDKNYNDFYRNESYLTTTTTADIADVSIDFEHMENTKQIFSNNKMDIYAHYIPDEYSNQRYQYYVVNKTDYDFLMQCENTTVNGKTDVFFDMRDEPVPSHGYFVTGPYWASGEDIDLATAEISMNMSFNCNEDPTQDFSTGYMNATIR